MIFKNGRQLKIRENHNYNTRSDITHSINQESASKSVGSHRQFHEFSPTIRNKSSIQRKCNLLVVAVSPIFQNTKHFFFSLQSNRQSIVVTISVPIGLTSLTEFFQDLFAQWSDNFSCHQTQLSTYYRHRVAIARVFKVLRGTSEA